MMLFKLSMKNIKKSFKDYAIYFFTLILGVSIFYVFNAIESQSVMMNINESTSGIIKLMNQILAGVSVFVSLILGALVIYASQFLIKRRNKEFGVYLTLGMSKRKISMILFFETLFIGVISLAVGLIIGVGLSQLMSLLVSSMFEADMTKFEFIFSGKACLKTLIYFSIMYLLVMIFNTFTVNRCKLIDLLYASRKSEKIKMKNPLLCTFIFVISACVLGYAYYKVTGGIEAMSETKNLVSVIIMGSVSTFFLFWSLSGLVLKIFMSMKKSYYKGLNSFTLRQVSSKINTTVIAMTLISLMLFVTICVFSSALSIRNSMTENIKALTPVDAQMYKHYDVDINNPRNIAYTDAQIADSRLTARYSVEKLGFDIDKKMKDVVEFDFYRSEGLVIRTALGDYYDKCKKEYPMLAYEEPEVLVRESDYNKLAQLFHMDSVSLDENQYAIVADFDGWVTIYNNALKSNPSITVDGKTLTPKYEKCINGFFDMSSNHVNYGVIIVPDNTVNDTMRFRNMICGNYKATTEEEKQKTEAELLATEKSDYAANTTVEASTRKYVIDSSVGLGALVTFVGLYLGIIFLISSAAILALKELSESSDNKERFRMLRKLGADEKMINRALFRQIGIFFLFPLLVAMLHSVFGIKFCVYILETFGKGQLLSSIVMTAVFMVVIYGGYFIITYFSSKNIIKE